MTITGLIVGREYTATVWVNSDASTGVMDLALGVSGIGTSVLVASGVGYQELNYEFTATATSHDLSLGYEAVDDAGSLLIWDDVTVTQDAWNETTVTASSVSDAVVRSQSGRILRNILTDSASAAAEVSTYSFDAAGRLTTAVIPHHTLSYGYGSSSIHPYVGLAAAMEAGVMVHAGLAWYDSPGLSWGGGCDASYYAGVYVDGAVGFPAITPIGGGGVTGGFGLGCSFGATWTF